ncbi:MAG TPA: proline dehydrogenase family protein, partial [Geobacteraceae bacterium]|nr:proline dehydrogenase family protein [Geobacteraceae bacterium]
MNAHELNGRIVARGKGMFAAIRHEKPSIFDTGSMLGRIMEWAMADDRFRTRLFRFVDLFPSLKSGEQLSRHIREYFGNGDDLPPLLAAAVSSAGLLGSFGGSVLSVAISTNIHEMAKQFIIGETLSDAVRNIGKLRRDGFAFAIDLLGEATLSHEEARRYADDYRELLLALRQAADSWHPLPGSGGNPALDWGDTPLINIAVKPSALYCLATPRDFNGSVEGILARLLPIVDRVRESGAFLCIDMENTSMKGITLEVYRRLKKLHPDYPWLGVAMQSYLRDTDRDLDDLLDWARRESIPIAIRLVKGAYWDYEMIRARQNGWPPPVWTIKAESDAAFERHTRRILEHHAICHFACATHNIRSIAAALETAAE